MRIIPLVTMLMLAIAASAASPGNTLSAAESIVIPATAPPVSRVWVFTDTSCPYCALLHDRRDEFARRGIAIHYLFYPRSGPDTESFGQAVAVWCSQDRLAALDLALRGAALPQSECDNPVREHYELARRLGLLGTPAIITADGAVRYGAVAAQSILDGTGMPR